MAPRGHDQVGQYRHSQRADTGSVAHVEVTLEIVQNAAHGAAIHQRALVRVRRKQQFARTDGQSGCLLDPDTRAVVSQVEMQPAEPSVRVPVARRGFVRAAGRKVQAPDEARTGAENGAGPVTVFRGGRDLPFARISLPRRQKNIENRA